LFPSNIGKIPRIKKKNPNFGDTYFQLEVEIKWDFCVFTIFQIGPPTAILMARARRELSIDMRVGRFILKTSKNT